MQKRSFSTKFSPALFSIFKANISQALCAVLYTVNKYNKKNSRQFQKGETPDFTGDLLLFHATGEQIIKK